MKKEAIITLPNTHLRQRSQRVGLITPEIIKLADDMKAAMLDWEASRHHEITVGLAAIQVDTPLKLFVIRDLPDKSAFMVFINPKIIKYEGSITEDYEGCLSIKDIYGLVPRHDTVRIRATGLDGKLFSLKAKGDIARILQHETDHTNGVVFIDHIKDSPEAFFRLSSDGSLQKLDFAKEVKDNHELWD